MVGYARAYLLDDDLVQFGKSWMEEHFVRRQG